MIMVVGYQSDRSLKIINILLFFNSISKCRKHYKVKIIF